MDVKEKKELNIKIKNYTGDNKFILSLKKHLKSNKYLEKVEYKNSSIRVLSEKQYLTAIDIFKFL